MGDKALKVIGLMSGTSLDGVDVAVLDTDGETVTGFGPTYFRPYQREERDIIEKATQAALKWNLSGVPPNIFSQAESVVDNAHIEAVRELLGSCELEKQDIDLVGYHGQTILHRPPQNSRPGRTLQLGNGANLAVRLGIDTVHDFRSNDMEMGGQGAPLAPAYHLALVRSSNLALPVAVLNIGGVSNFTIISNNTALSASDCGPGNGPLDSWIQKNQTGEYDKDGRIALSGTPDVELIAKWLERDFFQLKTPKSADRWDFDVLGDLAQHSVHDGAATLAAFTAEAVKHTLEKSKRSVETLIVCGGGRKNGAIMAALRQQNIGEVLTAEQIGWRGDDIEAEAFAFLAVRSLKGMLLSYPGTTGVRAPASGGKLAEAGD